MKIRVEHGDFSENEIVLFCKELDEECLDVLALFRERSTKLIAFADSETHLLKPGDIFYAEAVDGKTFLCTENAVLESGDSLAVLHEKYEATGLIRIGKSQLSNMYHIEKLKSIPNSRIEITLKNREKLIVSRHYIQNLKTQLGLYE